MKRQSLISRLSPAPAYKRSLEVAKENGMSSVSFPSISTGACGFPVKRAGKIPLGAIRESLRSKGPVNEVNMAPFSGADFEAYSDALEDLSRHS